MSEKLELKSISEILEYDFFIPSYQRGYRWGEQQVKDLLNDIWEFSQNKTNDEFYPLQPIVVFNDEENNRFEVIDGQQRITTIYIIFKYLSNLTKLFENNKEEIAKLNDIFGFCLGNIESLKDKIVLSKSIVYESRNEKEKNSQKFLNTDISKGIDTSNPDFYYMSSAYKTIKTWFQSNSIHLDLFVGTLLVETKVIWYEIKATTQKEKTDIFARLNIGKIELTNAELIKALLLQDEKSYKKQIELGNELDKIEYSLQDDKFWYFIANEEKDTKIDLIYELLADKFKQKYTEGNLDNQELANIDKKYDNKYSFYIFEYLLKYKLITRHEIFSNLKDYFRYLEEWYLDKEFYHKIGYILSVPNKIKLFHLLDEYTDNNIDKNNFRTYLNVKIENQIKGVKISKLTYGDNHVKDILLLFNIQTIINNKNISYKFDFHKYKSEKGWDIEHIRSQTDADITGEARLKWIETINRYFKKIENKDELKKDNGLFEEFYEEMRIDINGDESFDDILKDSIGNLTLLDSTTNRGYGNAFFPIKRAIIIDEDTSGRFIPPCTKNVFLKVYSNSIKDMMNWNKNDIRSHRYTIHKTLKSYLGLTYGK